MMESAARSGAKASVLAMDTLGDDVINDNSKRSISIRINTSDYGRIKAVSRRLRVRESDVFRFLVKIGLAEIAALCNSNSTSLDLLKVFATHGGPLVSHFKLNARRLDQVINQTARGTDVGIEMKDLELLAMTIFPERFLFYRLQELLGQAIDGSNVMDELKRYLEAKYVAATPADVPRQA